MRVCIHNSITEIDAAVWNSIVPPERLICRHEYLLAVERSNINNCHYYYPVVYEGDRPLAHTCLYVIKTELDLFATGLLKRMIHVVRSFYESFLIMTSLECGTPVALGHTISCDSSISHDETTLVLIQESEKLARSLQIGVLIYRDFSADDAPLIQTLQGAGFRQVRSLAYACLDVHWGSYDDYLKALRSTYRHRIQRRTEQFLQTGITVEILDRFSTWSGDLARLWKNAYDHAREYRREFLYADFFEQIDALLGPRSKIILMKNKKIPVAFALLLEQGPVLDWVFCGLDYSANKEQALYFNLLYQITRYGIENGFKQIHYGVTTLIPKMDIGARPIPLCMCMKHTNAVLNRVLPYCFDKLAFTQTPAPRHVFKNEAAL